MSIRILISAGQIGGLFVIRHDLPLTALPGRIAEALVRGPRDPAKFSGPHLLVAKPLLLHDLVNLFHASKAETLDQAVAVMGSMPGDHIRRNIVIG